MSRLERMIRFSVVAEELSFSRAARRLNVDQPWLSRQIQQLEAEVGFALFIRNTRKVELTPKGMILYEQAREVAETVDRTFETVRALGRTEENTLTVGVQPFTFWIPNRRRLLNGFQAAHPAVELRLVSNYTPRLISKLRRRLVDVAILPGPVGPVRDMEMRMISEQPMRLLAPIEDPIAKLPVVTPADLAGKTIVTFNPRLNPSLYEARYGPLIAAGAVAAPSPDGDLGLYFMAKTDRLILPSFDWPEADRSLLGDFVRVPLSPEFPPSIHWLVRRRGAESRAVEWLWNLAGDLEMEEAGAEGMPPALRAIRAS